ncbi:hypothetical protein LOK49_LG05G03265 [Camellia lanceoleosa]|uniref:Uncharacterized protein n=1 Tax=Camellia lanceoleosa TaxID=1840588 RepID=A0ACC0HKU5_9ERIC|nr:hypothetical protein LOK49_LG05G03265 [Camellia lanceoleosa]
MPITPVKARPKCKSVSGTGTGKQPIALPSFSDHLSRLVELKMASSLRRSLSLANLIAILFSHRGGRGRSSLRRRTPWSKPSPVRSESSPAFPKNTSVEGFVVIYSPARTATQQGSGKVGWWKINFLSTQKWENPLMGWTSTGDPYANVGDAGLSFDSEEAAKAFAEKHGWEYVVKKRHSPLLKVKAYADNLKWKGPAKD